jgi:Transposase DDE domain group 1
VVKEKKKHDQFQILYPEVTQMVRLKKSITQKGPVNQGRKQAFTRAIKIGPSTPYGYSDEHLTPFGGLLALEKLLDGLQFQELFENLFIEPARTTLYGSYFFVKGLLILLFIGFHRLYHFVYVEEDPMVLGVMGVDKLPAVSTFWRYIRSLGINQASILIKIMAVLRERAWKSLGITHTQVHIDIDTTVETVYGEIEGAKRGHNPHARGKKGLRPVLAFIAETREYLSGKLRRGETISGEETKKFIRSFKGLIPTCVKQVTIRADGEFFSWDAVSACKARGYRYIIALKRCSPVFDHATWYQVGKDEDIQYNQCLYQPHGWEEACRFVSMRIRKEPEETKGQKSLFEEDNYTYRTFVTDLTRKAHQVIDEYDDRAGAEPLIAEAKREGVAAIPSKRFQSNMVYFQIVMLAYNLWRYLKRYAEPAECPDKIVATVHVSRLKLLFIAAKIVSHSNRVWVKYSRHLRIRKILDTLYQRIDLVRKNPSIWASPLTWGNQRHPSMQNIFCTG